MTPAEIAKGLTPLQADVLRRCCDRGSTRTNEPGLVDDLLSGLCSNLDEGITNGWLVEWESNPGYREDGYVNRYKITELGKLVAAEALAE